MYDISLEWDVGGILYLGEGVGLSEVNLSLQEVRVSHLKELLQIPNRDHP